MPSPNVTITQNNQDVQTTLDATGVPTGILQTGGQVFGTALTSAQAAAVAAVVLDTTASLAAAQANRTAIQNALDAVALLTPNGGTVALYTATNLPAYIDQTLQIDSYTTLDAGIVELKAWLSNTTNLLVTKAYKLAGVSVTVTWTSGLLATLTYGAAHGLAVGDCVSVARADQGQFNGVFQVSTVTDSLNVIVRLWRLPSTTATGTIVARTAHKSIRVRGGTWNYNATGGNGGTGTQLHAVVLGHIWDLQCQDMRFRDTSKFGLCLGAIAHPVWHNISGEILGSDTVKCYGPMFNLSGERVFAGSGGDDILSLHTREPAAYVANDWTQGDIIGARISSFGGRSGTAGCPIYASPAGVLDGIELNNLNVNTTVNLAAVRIESQWTAGTCEVGAVTINSLICGGVGYGVTIGNGADTTVVQKLLINNPTFRFTGNAGRAVYFLGTNAVANITIRGGYATGIENLINTSNNTGTVTFNAEAMHIGTNWQPIRVAAACTLYVNLRDMVFDNNAGSALISTAAVAAIVYLSASNNKFASTPTISLGAGSTLRLSGAVDFPLDGTLLDTTVTNHAAGASFYNTNGGFGAGVGAYVRGSAAWVQVAA